MLFPTRKVLLVSGAMLAGIVSLMPAPSGTAATVVAPRPQQTIIVGTESGAAVLQVLNLGTGGAVIGQVGASEIGAATGAGLYGVFNPPSGVGEGVLGFASNGTGIVAETFGGAYAAIYAQNYSSAAEPAIQGVSNGNSIVGTSADSNSIVGITNDPTNGGVTAAGVLGEDGTSATYISNNVGVLGTTLSGDWGVEGTSSNSAEGGVGGFATTGYGVEGSSSGNYGVYGLSSSTDAGHFVSTASGDSGVAGISTSGNGTYGRSTTGFGLSGTNNDTSTPSPTAPPYTLAGAYAQSNVGTGVYGVSLENTGTGVGYDTNRYAGVFGFGNDGPGIEGYSYSDIGVYAKNDNVNYPTLFIENEDGTASNGISFYAFNDVTGDVTIADSNGNFYTSGSITSGSDTYQARTRNPGTDVTTYSAQHTEATVEDFGSAQLVDGVASVPLAEDFRQTINSGLPYMVFLTPYGENRGLYIASRTPAGFVVRENQPGRSTLSFDYRIVARPFGALHARLPHLSSVQAARLGLAQIRSMPRTRLLARGNGVAPEIEHAAKPALRSRGSAQAPQRGRFAVNHIPAGPPPSARALSQQFRLH